METADTVFNHLWLMAGTVTALLFGASELGYRIGHRLHVTRDNARKSQVDGVQNAILGILGLLLGFTFAMSVSRYDRRRELVWQESNAIGTTWLRSGLLPEKHRDAARLLLLEYTETRLEYGRAPGDSAVPAELLRRSAASEQRLWEIARAAAEEKPTPIVALFITSLNEMIDTDTARVTAMRSRIPATVWVLLLTTACCGCFVSTYASGSAGARSAFTGLLLPGLVMILMLTIFDLSHTRQGLIDISQRPIQELLETMRKESGRAATPRLPASS